MKAKHVDFGVIITGGVLILLSYIPVIRAQLDGRDLFFGISKQVKYVFYSFMILAALGFSVFAVDLYMNGRPTDGLFAYRDWVLPTILGLFLLGSALWSIFVLGNTTASKIATVLSLVVVSIGCLLLLAGYSEGKNVKPHVLIGLIFLNVTCTLFDAVVWNSAFIRDQLATN